MKIKRYVDADMRRVLRRVREDQGPDAVILSNRRTEDGIEVIAAIDYDESILQQAFGPKPGAADYLRLAGASNAAETGAATETVSTGETAIDTGTAVEIEVEIETGRASRTAAESPADALETGRASRIAAESPADALAAIETEASGAPEDAGAEPRQSPAAAAAARTEAESLDRMWSEISSIRGLMESQLSELIWKEQDRQSPIRAQVLRNLARMGISPDIAGIVVGRLDAAPQTRQVWRAPLSELVDMMPLKEDRLLAEGGVVALIGPTGVGKTTSIAKLAARFVMTNGSDDLALVCADSYRIGAKEHLSAFGQIIGTRVHSVSGPEGLGTLLDQLKSKKLVLIDTDGMSQRDMNLAARLTAYAGHADRVRFYLTLSAASQEPTLDETIRKFRALPLHGAVVCKIDEAGQLGCVMSSLIRNELPALWFSDGQKIPDDLHEASKKKLWILAQAIECMESSKPRIDELIMAQQYARASVAHA